MGKRITFTAKTDGGYYSEVPHYINLFLEDVGKVDMDKMSELFEGRRVRITVEALKGEKP